MDKTEKAKYDKLQTQLIITKDNCSQDCYKCKKTECEHYNLTIKPNTNSFAKKDIHDIIKNGTITICPFCLGHSYLPQFNYNKGFYECRFCHNLLKDTTLISMFEIFFKGKEIDVNRYVKFVFDYRLIGFWQKIISFEAFNEKLHFWNISYDFWEQYKKLKGDSKTERNVLKELGYE